MAIFHSRCRDHMSPAISMQRPQQKQRWVRNQRLLWPGRDRNKQRRLSKMPVLSAEQTLREPHVSCIRASRIFFSSASKCLASTAMCYIMGRENTAMHRLHLKLARVWSSSNTVDPEHPSWTNSAMLPVAAAADASHSTRTSQPTLLLGWPNW